MGYLTFVSTRAHKGNNYFDFYVGDDTKEHRVVSLNTNMRNILCKLLNSGIIFTKLRVDKTGYIFDNFSKFTEKEPPFPKKLNYEEAANSIKDAIETVPLYSRVTLIH